MKWLVRIVFVVVAALAALALLFALSPPALMGAYSFVQQDNHARPPVRIAEGVYWVGANDVAAYLIDTGDGLILLDGGYPSTAQIVLNNIAAILGKNYQPGDVRLILSTHAHFDHAGALAALQEATGAEVRASEADAALLRVGGRGDFYLRDFFRYTPVERLGAPIVDGDIVSLGNVTLTAHLTAGHTRGCTSWTFPVTLNDGRTVEALVICSLSTLSYELVGDDAEYEGIADDYRRSYDTLQSLPCDVFLGAHGRWFDIEGKRERVANREADAFYDPNGCRDYLADERAAFEAKLARQGRAR